jgi:hypothetical protein
MGLPQSTMQRLGVAVALIYALSLAGLNTSHAASSNASETDYVNGPPCNDLCNAYMAWSDRVLARSHPSEPQMRVVVPHKRPDRTVHRASETRQLDLNLFAQFPRRSNAAPQAVETPHVRAAPSEPVKPITEGLFPADGIVTAKSADAGVAKNESPETTRVSATGLISATQDNGTTRHFVARDGRFALSLALAISALLSLLSWGYLRRRMQTANPIR